MATSKKGPLYPSRDRATRMAPNLKPSSSEFSSSGYGARRARSVPSSPDRKLGPSAAAAAAAAPSASPDMCRPSLSHAGRSISSRTMSGSGPSIHGSKPASKPALARAKSDKVTANSQRPHALAGPLSSSFKDTANSSSTLLKNKLSPRPTPGKGVASPKPSIQRASSPSLGALRGGKPLPLSSARAPGTAAKKREAAANGGANANSRPRGAPQRAAEPSTTTRKEKDDEPSMRFEESESLTTPSIEDQLQEQLPDPVDLKPIDMAVSASASASPRRDQQGPHTQQQGKNEEEIKEQPEKEDADIAKVADELDQAAETEDAITKASGRTEAAQSWRKDDPKSNDVIEETKSKLLEERNSRVKALVGAFETAMSFKE
ncbi:unnamed protein product [Triticum aestivum]|uniref:Calmodulin-binding domain-containing protein n=1 Tax=Triticum aestivum TaxID=4565 RepID=A0A7H4LHG5_WHEAT|nr:nucleolar and coiled-body phosphoprotein 1-like [Triticum aestivum]XP_044332329.1 nucleolar and coiled-body phosphoprotein 1-like [Triticum aestivum]XP_044332330.1 nucleolar and coiled-body phosphoprotein 1-like [Triticum aestivum]XP_044332331.1 nucleolar and coiled-body phosphoprotein 1-like [Triticum aestivum]XP_044332332.1 nucleolar and coiled-body phosphoprotein 1-like [Triticum aestivum]SPT18053.1 unnamed protein product [Triticum aestivum]